MQLTAPPPPRVQVSNEWTYTCTLSLRLHGMHRDSFAVTSCIPRHHMTAEEIVCNKPTVIISYN
jgi:hypothetical protein